MYLTRMPLDVTRRSTMRALISPPLFHGAIESAFPGPRHHPLWRVDRLNGQHYLLLLSRELPDLTAAAQQFGFGDGEPWQSKSYTPLLDRIQNGTVWHFRLTANPTHSGPSGANGQRGKVYAHITPEHQRKWLETRAERNGFSLKEEAYQVVNSRWLRFRRGDIRNVSLLSVTYEGMLTVTDAEAFRTVLQTGIGRGKAYGMGLMTVVGKHG